MFAQQLERPVATAAYPENFGEATVSRLAVGSAHEQNQNMRTRQHATLSCDRKTTLSRHEAVETVTREGVRGFTLP